MQNIQLYTCYLVMHTLDLSAPTYLPWLLTKFSYVADNDDLVAMHSLLQQTGKQDLYCSKEIAGNQCVQDISKTIYYTKQLLKTQSLTSHLWITYFEKVSSTLDFHFFNTTW